eukprot:305223_1
MIWQMANLFTLLFLIITPIATAHDLLFSDQFQCTASLNSITHDHTVNLHTLGIGRRFFERRLITQYITSSQSNILSSTNTNLIHVLVLFKQKQCVQWNAYLGDTNWFYSSKNDKISSPEKFGWYYSLLGNPTCNGINYVNSMSLFSEFTEFYLPSKTSTNKIKAGQYEEQHKKLKRKIIGKCKGLAFYLCQFVDRSLVAAILNEFYYYEMSNDNDIENKLECQMIIDCYQTHLLPTIHVTTFYWYCSRHIQSINDNYCGGNVLQNNNLIGENSRDVVTTYGSVLYCKINFEHSKVQLVGNIANAGGEIKTNPYDQSFGEGIYVWKSDIICNGCISQRFLYGDEGSNVNMNNIIMSNSSETHSSGLIFISDLSVFEFNNRNNYDHELQQQLLFKQQQPAQHNKQNICAVNKVNSNQCQSTQYGNVFGSSFTIWQNTGITCLILSITLLLLVSRHMQCSFGLFVITQTLLCIIYVDAREQHLFVRKQGCDFGYCTSDMTIDYQDICINQVEMIGSAANHCCPTQSPTLEPTSHPTINPTTKHPTNEPTNNPTTIPTSSPTDDPTKDPTESPMYCAQCNCPYEFHDIVFLVDTSCPTLTQDECVDQQEMIAELFAIIRNGDLGVKNVDGIDYFSKRLSYIEFGSNSALFNPITFTSYFNDGSDLSNINQKTQDYYTYIRNRRNVICDKQHLSQRQGNPNLLGALSKADNLFDLGRSDFIGYTKKLYIFSNCAANNKDQICDIFFPETHWKPGLNGDSPMYTYMMNTLHMINPEIYMMCLVMYDDRHIYVRDPSTIPSSNQNQQWSLGAELWFTIGICDRFTVYPTIIPLEGRRLLGSITPTSSPTIQPTPFCPVLNVTAIDAVGFDAEHFNGLYTLNEHKIRWNHQVWEVPQYPDDQNIYYTGLGWIINGRGDEQLSYADNNGNFPDLYATWAWSHSSVAGQFHVQITCIESFSPTYSPTLSPTALPTSVCTNANTECFDQDINPLNTASSTSVIQVHSTTDDGYNVNYLARFNIGNANCIHPRITIYFRDNDFNDTSRGEYLYVYYKDDYITSCGSGSESQCNVFDYCVYQHSIPGVPLINQDSQFIVRLVKGYGVNRGCSPIYSLVVDVSLTCTKIPTQSPTSSPTFSPTLAPTSAPTSSCNNPNTVCIYKDIYPSFITIATSTIQIASTIDNGQDINYFARFNIINQDCVSPKLTVYYRNNDFDTNEFNEYLRINHDNHQIAECGSAHYRQCNIYEYCLNEYTINGVLMVEQGRQFVVNLIKGSGVNTYCNPAYSLWATVSLSCSKLVSAQPTLTPSIFPTRGPSHQPSPLSVELSNVTTAQPTNTPVFEPTCESITYGWNCFFGIGGFPNTNGCAKVGYNGNGVVDLGIGDWNFPYCLNFSDNNITIKGQNPSFTVWNYIGKCSTWMQCTDIKCYLSLQDLTIKSNRNNGDDVQFYMTNGGTLFIKNVVFDGINYIANNKGNPFWKFMDNDVNITFEDCHFVNNNVIYQFLNGVQALFIKCTFEDNTIDNVVSDRINGMFHIDGGSVVFKECVFQNNTQDVRYLFSIQNEANVTMINSSFNRNINVNQNTNLFYIAGTYAKLSLSDCAFVNNYGYQELINIEHGGTIEIDATKFYNNMNVRYDLKMNGSLLSVLNSQFLHGQNYESSIFIVNAETSIISIEDCIWDNYDISNAILANKQNTNPVITFMNNTIQHINLSQNASAFNIHSYGAASIYGSKFYNITGNIFGSVSNIEFISGYFQGNDQLLLNFNDDSYVKFINISFLHNIFSDMNIANNATVLFSNCYFIDNKFNQSLMVLHGGKLKITNTTFDENHGFLNNINKSSIIKISSEQSFDNTINNSLIIQQCTFHNDYNINSIIESIDNGNNIKVFIYDTTFTDSCADIYCLIFIESDVFIDESSLKKNKSILFGHDINYQTRNIALHLIDFEPENLQKKVELIHFGSNNNTVVFEPCNPFDPRLFPSLLLFHLRTLFVNITEKFNVVGEFFEQTFNCNNFNNPNNTICYIICQADLSCISSKINIIDKKISIVGCVGDASCRSTEIFISSSTNASILCRDDHSCQDSIITITDVNEATIECFSSYACLDMTLNISRSPDTTVICYDVNSCESLTIYSSSNNISYYFYNYNNNVLINLPSNLHLKHLHCDPNQAYLKLNAAIAHQTSFADHMKQLFSSNPPCEDIQFNFYSSKPSCVLQYDYKTIQDIHPFESYMRCYHVHIAEFTDITCIGTKHPTMDPTKYPTEDPTTLPTIDPTTYPSIYPTTNPSTYPTTYPTIYPTVDPTNDPTKYPTNDPTNDPTTSPIHTPCSYSNYGLDVAFLVDNSCGLNSIECAQQQEGIAELLSSIKLFDNPRFMYLKFGAYSNLTVSLNNKLYNNLASGGATKAEKNFISLYNNIRYDDCGPKSPTYLNTAIDMTISEFVTHAGIDLNRYHKIVIFSNCRYSDSDPCFDMLKYKLSKLRKIEIVVFNIITTNTDFDTSENYLKCLTENDENRWEELASAEILLSNSIVDRFRNEICNKPTMSPTSEPTIDPTQDPTTNPSDIPTYDPTRDPTKDPTTNPTGYPTRSNPVLKKVIMVLDKVFGELPEQEDDLRKWALQFITVITNIEQHSVLKDLIIEIVRVRKGSVIIEYTIEANSIAFIDIAMENIRKSPKTFKVLSNVVLACDYFDFDDSNSVYFFDAYQQNEQTSMEQLANAIDYDDPNIYSIKCDTLKTKEQCNKLFEKTLILPLTPYEDHTIKELVMLCRYCGSANITINNINNLSLYCDGNKADKDTSCNGLRLDIIGGTFNIKVRCYSQSSCENLLINAINVKEMQLTMEMYEHSGNIQILYPGYKSGDIELACNVPNKPHFILVNNSDNIQTEWEVLKLSRDTYDSGHLPCDGIIINTYCTVNYDYFFNKQDTLINELPVNEGKESLNECYWFDIEKLFAPNIQCNQAAVISLQNKTTEIFSYLMASCIFGIIIWIYLIVKWRRQKHRDTKAIDIRNPMVIFCAIGDYFQPPPDNAEFDAYCRNLQGIELDIENMRALFKEILNYQCYTFYYDNDPQYPKVELEKKEIVEFMKEKAKILAHNVALGKCDGLLVVVSGHGYNGNIITSDYGLLNEDKLHRIFSKYKISRHVPRIFMFDCCDGGQSMQTMRGSTDRSSIFINELPVNEEQETTGKDVGFTDRSSIFINEFPVNEEQETIGKDVGFVDVEMTLLKQTHTHKRRQIDEVKYDKQSVDKIRNKTKRCCQCIQCSIKIKTNINNTTQEMLQLQISNNEQGKNQHNNKSLNDILWQRGTLNPDTKLAIIHAANKDFQAKMASNKGSYLIEAFVTNTIKGLQQKQVPFIGEIFKEIQETLGENIQLPTFTWNNKTDDIRFNINKSNNTFDIPSNEQTNELQIAFIDDVNEAINDASKIKQDQNKEKDNSKGIKKINNNNNNTYHTTLTTNDEADPRQINYRIKAKDEKYKSMENELNDTNRRKPLMIYLSNMFEFDESMIVDPDILSLHLRDVAEIDLYSMDNHWQTELLADVVKDLFGNKVQNRWGFHLRAI